VINEHPYAVRVLGRLEARGVARPLPRDYGLRVISEALHTLDQLRAQDTYDKENAMPFDPEDDEEFELDVKTLPPIGATA